MESLCVSCTDNVSMRKGVVYRVLCDRKNLVCNSFTVVLFMYLGLLKLL